MTIQRFYRTWIAILALAASVFFSAEAFAHCDTLDGPVVSAAKEALKTGDVKPVLAWVQKDDEQYMKGVFEKTLAVRKLSPEAQEFADSYFFETLVRIHRAGEGAPYTGLKPAGQVEHAVALADKAVDTGSAEQLTGQLNEAVSQGVGKRFKELVEKKKHANESVAAGRAYVASYVEFVHYVERLHDNAVAGGHEHSPKAEQGGQPAHDHKAGNETKGHDHKAPHDHK